MWSRIVILAGFWLAAAPAFAADDGRAAIESCDRMAAGPFDTDKPATIAGIGPEAIDKQNAIVVCREALKVAGAQTGPQAIIDLRRVQYELGRALYEYEFGRALANNELGRGFEKSEGYAEVMALYGKAAAAGSAAAMNSLGALYETNDGLSGDYAAARDWYEKAAAAGDADAMNNLGNLHQFGRGVAQDYRTAIGWYEKAAAANNTDAMSTLANLYYEGRGVPQSYTAAIGWYEKLAATGDMTTMSVLGAIYAEGLVVPQDYAAARRWYKRALDAGDSTAKGYLDKLDVSATPALAESEAVAYERAFFRTLTTLSPTTPRKTIDAAMRCVVAATAGIPDRFRQTMIEIDRRPVYRGDDRMREMAEALAPLDPATTQPMVTCFDRMSAGEFGELTGAIPATAAPNPDNVAACPIYTDQVSDGAVTCYCQPMLGGIAYGRKTYSDTSSICLAATHAGAVDYLTGGVVSAAFDEGCASYEGVEANGTLSAAAGRSARSFHFPAVGRGTCPK